MAINLKKNEGINLKKTGTNEGLNKITLGLGWKSGRKIINKKSQGLLGKLLGKAEEFTESINNRDIDLDSAIVVYKDNNYINTCYYGNKQITIDGNKIIYHHGDDTTGHNKMTNKDNEQIEVFLSNVNTNKVNRLYLIMNVFSSGVTLEEVRDAYINVYDEKGEVLAVYNLSEDYKNKNGVLIGKVVYDESEGWKFIANGEGCNISNIEQFRII